MPDSCPLWWSGRIESTTWCGRVMYVLTAIIAVEILDALWWAAGHLSGAEIGVHFIRAGWTAAICVFVVRHHSRLYGSGQNQQAAYRCPCHVLSAGAYRIHHRRVVLMGYIPLRVRSVSSTEG